VAKVAEGEVNDPERQRRLRMHAETLAARLSEQEAVLAVWLSGSVARGPVGPASDLDLHVVALGKLDNEVPPWRFGPEGVIENVHVVLREDLEEGLHRLADPTALAEWLHRTALGDELQGSECLFNRKDWSWIEDGVGDLLTRRLHAEVVAALAAQHAATAEQWAIRAEQDLSAGSAYDGHQKLRYATQSLLVAALIRCDWTIRGSKKRPEIARAYADDPTVGRTLALLDDVVGIAEITGSHARRICAARLELRNLLLEELRRLCAANTDQERIRLRLGKEIEFQKRHNAFAVDYYAPLLDGGFFKGPVNHIRALSGFARVPERLCHCLDWDLVAPIGQWFRQVGSPRQLLDAWLKIAELSPTLATVGGWAKVVRAEAQRAAHDQSEA